MAAAAPAVGSRCGGSSGMPRTRSVRAAIAAVLDASARTAAAAADFQRFMAALPLHKAARIEARFEESVNQLCRECEPGSEMVFQFKRLDRTVHGNRPITCLSRAADGRGRQP